MCLELMYGEGFTVLQYNMDSWMVLLFVFMGVVLSCSGSDEYIQFLTVYTMMVLTIIGCLM